MITVFLAYILFSTMNEEAPKIVSGFRATELTTALDHCFVEARSKNHLLDGEPGPRIGGYVCPQMRGEV